jgi:hypothetical protein
MAAHEFVFEGQWNALAKMLRLSSLELRSWECGAIAGESENGIESFANDRQ